MYHINSNHMMFVYNKLQKTKTADSRASFNYFLTAEEIKPHKKKNIENK